MSQSPGGVQPIYTIDVRDRLVSLNDAWLRFAYPGDDPEAVRGELLGRSVWELVPAGEMCQLWELLYRRVRGMGVRLFVPMRVDTPAERRLLDIELRPLPERAIEHVCERVWNEARTEVRALRSTIPRDSRTLRRCGWCARVQVGPAAWEEIEQALITMAVEPRTTVPALATVACTTCKQSLLKTLPLRAA